MGNSFGNVGLVGFDRFIKSVQVVSLLSQPFQIHSIRMLSHSHSVKRVDWNVHHLPFYTHSTLKHKPLTVHLIGYQWQQYK